MKLHEALRKTIRHFGINVIGEKRLMSFLADYKVFDDYPAVKEVMRAIATGDSGKKICLAADESDEEFLRIAGEIRETLVREKSFKEEFARYAMDSVSFALGIVSSVSEPSDHGYEAVRKDSGSQGSSGAQGSGALGSGTQGSPKATQAAAPRQASPKTAFTVSGDTWQTASDGAESHRRFYRGHDLTAAFDSGEFSRNVADGSFRDIFPGDYIIKQITIPDIRKPHGSVYIAGKTYGIKFVIADLDYALSCEYSGVTAHHTVIIPEKSAFDSRMNLEPIFWPDEHEYASSYMHKIVMPAFAAGLAGAFGTSHLLSFSTETSVHETADRRQSCTCRLMTLPMVSGKKIELIHAFWDSVAMWSVDVKDTYMGGVQFSVFRLHPDLKGSHLDGYWVSDAELRKAYNDFMIVRLRDSSDDLEIRPAQKERAGVRPFALLV